jgi:hypothetical protein
MHLENVHCDGVKAPRAGAEGIGYRLARIDTFWFKFKEHVCPLCDRNTQVHDPNCVQDDHMHMSTSSPQYPVWPHNDSISHASKTCNSPNHHGLMLHTAVHCCHLLFCHLST